MKSSVKLMADAYCPFASFVASSLVTSMVLSILTVEPACSLFCPEATTCWPGLNAREHLESAAAAAAGLHEDLLDDLNLLARPLFLLDRIDVVAVEAGDNRRLRHGHDVRLLRQDRPPRGGTGPAEWPRPCCPRRAPERRRAASSGSTRGSLPITLPLEGQIGLRHADAHLLAKLDLAASCSGTVKSTFIDDRSWKLAMTVPGCRYWPTSIRGMPITPENGAFRAFCSMVACRRARRERAAASRALA